MDSLSSNNPPGLRWTFLLRMYAIEGLASVGSNLIQLGIFFYMQHRFGWGVRQNLLLSCAQGMVYVVGALAANPLSMRFYRQKLLRVLHIGMATCMVLAAISPSPAIIVPLILAYVIMSAAQWPLLESLISIGADAHQLSRRISIYNLVWAGVGAATLAVAGIIIARYQTGIFWVAMAAHLAALSTLIWITPQTRRDHAHIDPEPELLQAREMARRLSRIALPATYALIYAVSAIMPTLPVIRSASPESRTILASVWMVARWLSFVALGASAWWHTRPRALLVAAIVLFFAFLGITLAPQLTVMILCQIAMGLGMGLIYSASLYFGTVLSDGSTAQNAYHEALIGLGSVVGPGCGALADVLLPGNPRSAVYAVGAILWISVIGACLASVRTKAMAEAAAAPVGEA